MVEKGNIENLPLELLCIIFAEGLEDSFLPEDWPYTVSQVNRRWRGCAIGLPALWTAISFEERTFSDDWQRQTLAIDRSGDKPLDIKIDGDILDDATPEELHDILDIIKPYAMRWRSFESRRTTADICSAIANCIRDLQLVQLESMYFGVDSDYGLDWGTMHALSPLHVPALRDLQTFLVPYDFTSSAFTNLRTLELEDPRFDDTGMADLEPPRQIGRMIAKLLSLSPRVERILIRIPNCVDDDTVCSFKAEDLIPPPPSTHTSLSFVDLNDLDSLMEVVEYISLPNLSEVAVSEESPGDFFPQDVVHVGKHNTLPGLKELWVSVETATNPTSSDFWDGVGTFTSVETLMLRYMNLPEDYNPLPGELHRLGSICPALKTLKFSGWHPDPGVVLAIAQVRAATNDFASLERVSFDPDSEEEIEFQGDAVKQLSQIVAVDFKSTF